jgi:hypothetical protein
MKIVLNQDTKHYLSYKSIDLSIFIDFIWSTVINEKLNKLK